jgi:hypothetical protein
MVAKLLTERFAYQGGRVDRTGSRPVVRGVLLCGASSANRRRYRKEAFAGERVKRYDGKPVFLNHGEGRSGRRYEDRIAKVINPRLNAAGLPVGDLEVRPKHPYAEAFLDDCENDPTSVGMSHVANCATVRASDGWEEISEIERVESVDVVLDPATTRGLFESTNRKGKTVKLSKYLEARVLLARRATHAERRAAALVVEESPADTEVGDEMAGIANHDDDEIYAALSQGYTAALVKLVTTAVTGAKDPAEVGRKVQKLLRALQTAKDGGAAAVTDATESRRVGWQDDAGAVREAGRVTWSDDAGVTREAKTRHVTWAD